MKPPPLRAILETYGVATRNSMHQGIWRIQRLAVLHNPEQTEACTLLFRPRIRQQATSPGRSGSIPDRIYTLLSENPGNEAAILQRLASEHRNQRTQNTALRPHAPCTTSRKALTFRITPQLHSTLETLSEFMGLETSSIIRLALYHYLTHIAGFTERLTPPQLQEHLTELEAQAAAVGLPGFVELMTNTPTRYHTAYPPIDDTHLEAAEEYDP